ncbi:MAG TPA: hypothetical protein PLZ95_00475 [Bryobacteraceae bacterium]|nr:hypothetical protein [Bryobacteraceae bacterium]
MKVLVHTLVALALALTLVSGLCMGCVQTGSEHKCCRHQQKQLPSCHQPQPSEQDRCDCPDTGRIMASALEAKQDGKLVSPFVAIVASLDQSDSSFTPLAGIRLEIRAGDSPPPDLLSLHHILRI